MIVAVPTVALVAIAAAVIVALIRWSTSFPAEADGAGRAQPST
jgi:hypothetical protein